MLLEQRKGEREGRRQGGREDSVGFNADAKIATAQWILIYWVRDGRSGAWAVL